MKLIKFLSCLIAVIALVNSANAAVIYTIATNSSGGSTAGNIASGVTVDPGIYNAGAGLNAGSQLVIDSFSRGDFNQTTLASAVTAADSINWRFSYASAGNQLDLTFLSLSYASNVPNLQMQVDTTGTGNSFVNLGSLLVPNASGTTVNLNLPATISSGGAVSFRLVGWGDTSPFNASLSLFNGLPPVGTPAAQVSFQLNGTINAVPEPSSMLLVGLIGSPALVWYRRRRIAKAKN